MVMLPAAAVGWHNSGLIRLHWVVLDRSIRTWTSLNSVEGKWIKGSCPIEWELMGCDTSHRKWKFCGVNRYCLRYRGGRLVPICSCCKFLLILRKLDKLRVSVLLDKKESLTRSWHLLLVRLGYLSVFKGRVYVLSALTVGVLLRSLIMLSLRSKNILHFHQTCLRALVAK